MLIGYARVSTEDQNLDLQRRALTEAGCTKIFEEKESGRVGTKRPAFQAALAYLRPEDQLVVWKLDRLGRSLREMLNTAHDLQAQGIKVQSLTEKLDTESANGRLMFNILGTLSDTIRFGRAGGRCEGCERPHGRLVCHLGDGRWWDDEALAWRNGLGRQLKLAPSPLCRPAPRS